jgi:hypothetical protein
MKKFIIYFLLLNLISACGSVQESFSLKKKDNSDEFLVEKKSPLIMPPNFDDLPEPKDFQPNTDNKKDNEFEKIINKPQNNQSKTVIKKTTIEQSVIEKIK